MSALARTALRLSVVAALNADPTIGNMVRGCVYDSRITDLDAKEPVPVIVVYTEDESGDQFSRNNGGPPFNSSVDLILEITIRAAQPTTDGSPPDLILPFTDAEMEASLDLIEERAIDVITVANTPQSRVIRDNVTRRVSKMRSSRFVLDGAGDKLATRMVTLTTELKNPEPDNAADPAQPGLFGLLPDPLRSVCMALDPTSPEYATCKALAARWTPEWDTPFKGVDLTYQYVGLTPDGNPILESGGPVSIALADAAADVLVKQSIDQNDG